MQVERAKPVQHRLIKLPEVLKMSGLSRTALYERIRAGDFPTPVKLSERSVAWLQSEVNAWIEDKVLARDSRPRRAR
jgi:prophage regulatory protein